MPYEEKPNKKEMPGGMNVLASPSQLDLGEIANLLMPTTNETQNRIAKVNNFLKQGDAIFINSQTGEPLRPREIKKNPDYIPFVQECINHILPSLNTNGDTTVNKVDIKLLQNKVGARVDGVFGPKTYAKVAEYLRKQNAPQNQPIEPNSEPRVVAENGFDISTIRSRGKEWTKSGMTRCSGTTVDDTQKIAGINLPAGIGALQSMNLKDYENFQPLVCSIFTDKYQDIWPKYMPKNCTNVSCTDNLSIISNIRNGSIPEQANFGEVFLEGHRKYGHRAILILGKDGERYVLDPYIGGGGKQPQLLSTYLTKCHRDVYRINFFQTQSQEKYT